MTEHVTMRGALLATCLAVTSTSLSLPVVAGTCGHVEILDLLSLPEDLGDRSE